MCRDHSPGNSGCQPLPGGELSSQHTGIILSAHLYFKALNTPCRQRRELRGRGCSQGLGPAGSFPLFGRGDAAVQLLAVGAEGPLLGFAARVGAVPITKSLGLPVPCRGRRHRGRKSWVLGEQSPRSCVLAGSRVLLMLWVLLGLDLPRTGCNSCPHWAGNYKPSLYSSWIPLQNHPSANHPSAKPSLYSCWISLQTIPVQTIPLLIVDPSANHPSANHPLLIVDPFPNHPSPHCGSLSKPSLCLYWIPLQAIPLLMLDPSA